MKGCRKCKSYKPLNEYYFHPMMADGHLNICKECVRIRVCNYAKTEAGKEIERRRQKSQRRKIWSLKYQKIRRSRDKAKYKSRTWVSNALRDGRLSRKPCEVCGIEKVEAHHPDYSKPKVIRWLCKKHHHEIHPQFTRKYKYGK